MALGLSELNCQKFIYLDSSATTYVKKDVWDEMKPYFTEEFGNASSMYALGKRSRIAIENARERVAHAINCKKEEIFFTSGGTESDNLAIKGIAFANRSKGNHIITSLIEHPAIINSCKYLEKQGFDITYLPVDKYGMISIKDLHEAITDKTILISIMFANNEIGTIQPIEEIGKISREKGIYFHTDAVQAIGNIPIDVKKYNIDMLSLSAHKFYGPKGIGAIYINENVNIDSFIHGGNQENGIRSGTENVAGIVGLGKAIELTTNNIIENSKKVEKIRNIFVEKVLNRITDIELNGHPTKRLPGNVSLSFEFIQASQLSLMLDIKGIATSSGSACSCKSNKPSHVLKAIGLSDEKAKTVLRFTFGTEISEKDIDYVLETLEVEVEKIRKNFNKN
ncbi:cysteine desulfurase NifS [Planotetraspora mira]|uniref:cysteine desulfurase NifS n=1 Tax=Planotetraspora mira TaxID=58121 RepID=UPI00366EAE86